MIRSRNIDDLHPTVARGARELIRRMAEHGEPVLVTDTFRDNAAQDALFAQGRTQPGAIVTNARGGQSIHNYRLAFDIAKNIRGQEFSDPAFFALAGRIWTEMGGVWGGSWASFPDRPHMEFTGGLTVAGLQAGATLPQNTKMAWEEKQKEAVQETEPGGEDVRRFQHFNDLPDWAKPTIQKLTEQGFLKGTEQGFDLSEDMVRIFVVHDRAGMYGPEVRG